MKKVLVVALAVAGLVWGCSKIMNTGGQPSQPAGSQPAATAPATPPMAAPPPAAAPESAPAAAPATPEGSSGK